MSQATPIEVAELFNGLEDSIRIDVDPESAISVDRCLHHVRERLSNYPLDCADEKSEGVYQKPFAAADGSHATVAAHMDDIDACRDRLWQYIYHPKRVTSEKASLGSPSTSASPHARSGFSNRQNTLAVLRKMETREKEQHRQQLEDVASRSIGTGIDVASGDAAEQIVLADQTTITPAAVENAAQHLAGDQQTESKEATKTPSPTRRSQKPHQRKEALLAFFDALRPDEMVGALALPTSHFGNDPYRTKRSTNMLLLKYLGITFPGGKKALQEHLPFAARKGGPRNAADNAPHATGEEGEVSAQVAASKVGGRALLLFEDQRRRAILSAVTTQLGGGAASPATFSQCLSDPSIVQGDERRRRSPLILRIGSGCSSGPTLLAESEAANRIMSLHGLANYHGKRKDGRPLTVRAAEYALSCFTTSPFSQAQYPVKLFGFIQPTAIGQHSTFPMTRFNIFELEHLQTPAERLKANLRRAKRMSGSTTPVDEELCLKKWSVFGTIFPATNAFHVKAMWSANAKMTAAEVDKAFNSSSNLQQGPNDCRSTGSVISSKADPNTLLHSAYRLGTGPKEKALVSVGIDADKVRAIELLPITNESDRLTIDARSVNKAAATEGITSNPHNSSPKPVTRPPRQSETVSRPLTQSDRRLLGVFHDSEISLGWRRYWNPRWQVEAYVRNVTASSQPSAYTELIDGDIAEEVPLPSATLAGVRIRSDHKGLFFVQRPRAWLSMWFADTISMPGWASSSWATSAFLDPIQRHGSLKATVDITNLSFMPQWWSSYNNADDTMSASTASRAYSRVREFLSFDFRLQMAAEAKGGGDVAALYYDTMPQRAGEGGAKRSSGDESSSPLTSYLHSVKLPNPQSNTVRGVSSHPEAVYGTQRMGGRWFLTSTLELSKPFNIGSGSAVPPLRFLVFWNGLWSANAANNKESVGYAVRREPHASRRELKGWYNEYLPTQLECSWSQLWSSQRKSFTSDPKPSDLPAGSTFFKFMKCGAVWDLQ